MGPTEAVATADTALADPTSARAWRRITLHWTVVVAVLFLLMLLAGLTMRAYQGEYQMGFGPDWFYALLTLHGLGMVGTWYVGAMAGVSYRLARFVRPGLGVARFAYLGTAVGIVLLVIATLVGRFGAGWYFLHPLPFYSGGMWPQWSIGMFFAALGVLGVTWTIWTLDLLRAVARRYSLGGALAWHVIRGKEGPGTPPFVLVATSTLISAIAAFVAAVIMLALFVAEWLGSGFVNDALLMKNLIFFFGHGLVNITMYLGVALVYDLLPEFSSRKLYVNKPVAWAWNLAILLVLLVYFHHLYMDFVQPRFLQYLGQIGSYLIAIPAAVISIFSVLYVVYGARVRWTLAALFLFFGVMGWAIGGMQAVIDSTISANFRFHNTQWVPAHFHTYYLLGVVMMVLGTLHHLAGQFAEAPEDGRRAKLITTLFLIGGYGFILMFALGGAHSVPRRYATYPQDVAQGIGYARMALPFIGVLLTAVLLYLWDTGRRCVQAFRA
jgi:cytochrome c oxidase subunit 1